MPNNDWEKASRKDLGRKAAQEQFSSREKEIEKKVEKWLDRQLSNAGPKHGKRSKYKWWKHIKKRKKDGR